MYNQVCVNGKNQETILKKNRHIFIHLQGSFTVADEQETLSKRPNLQF